MNGWFKDRTPTQLLWMVAGANLFVAAGFGLTAYPWWHWFDVKKPAFATMMCIFGMMFVGIFVDMCAKNTLRLGIAENRWPDRLLEGTRELVNRRIFSLISGVFLAGAILSMVYFFYSHAGYIGGGFVFLYPAMSLNQLRSTVNPKQSSSNSVPLKVN